MGKTDPVLKVASSENTAKIDLLTSVIIKQSQQISLLQNEVEELKSRAMRDNVLLHNIPEEDGRTIEQAAKHALKKSGIDIDHVEFDRIHRIGEKRADGKPRTIVAKPSRYRDTEMMLRLNFKRDRKDTSPWISPQHTEYVRETRRQLGAIAESRKKQNPGANIKLRFTTLTVNGQQVKPSLDTPTIPSILTMDPDEREQLHRIPFQSSDTIYQSGSSFTAHATNVKSLCIYNHKI